MKTDSLKTYNSIDRAVIIAEGRDIVFYNTAAERVFPNIAEAKADELFHPDFLLHNAEHFVGCSVINNIQTSVNVDVSGNRRVFTLCHPDSQPFADARNLLVSISTNMTNSMAALKAATGMILKNLENSTDEKVKRYSEIITHSCYKMHRIAGNIAAVSSTSSQFFSAPTYFDIADMCRTLTDSTRHLLTSLKTSIEFVCSADRISFYGVYAAIERMILNLLSNSIKYTHDNGKITIELEEKEKYITIKVIDNGDGIAADKLCDIWNRYAYESNPKDFRDASGLGLSVVYQSVSLHEGTAVIESKDGNGTTVTVKLPLRRPDEIVVRDELSPYINDGMQPLLIELSDVLEFDRYNSNYMD